MYFNVVSLGISEFIQCTSSTFGLFQLTSPFHLVHFLVLPFFQLAEKIINTC